MTTARTLFTALTCSAFVACAQAAEDPGASAQTDDLAAGASLWSTTTTPATTTSSDGAAVELGVRFSVDVDGTVAAIRFYKGAGNTGTHTGHLWAQNGALLGSVTFASETASGWQTATFASPIALHAHGTYVASYRAPHGHYADDEGYFASPHDHGVLHAPRDGNGGPNGVYHYGATAFPTDGWNASNYWVDVVFAAATAADAGTDAAAPHDAATPHDAGTDAATPHDAGTDAAAPTGWPRASNTGVPAGTTLTPSGGLDITTANAVIDSLNITGVVRIDAPNVTIRRSRINASGGYYAVLVDSGSVTVEDTELVGWTEAGLAFDNWTGLRLNLHAFAGDGCKLGSNVRLQDSWIHDFASATGDHADGCQLQSGEHNIVVQHNFIDSVSTTGQGTNSALFFAPDLGPSANGPVLIDHNLLGGGGYTLYIVDGSDGTYHESGYTVTNNRFLANSGYGPLDINETIGTWSGNVMDATGAPLMP